MRKKTTDKPLVHLWDQGLGWVDDQISFFCDSFEQNGYATSVATTPRTDALNFVIENITKDKQASLVDFCTTQNKRLCVIMTEHIDVEGGELLFHGKPLGQQDSYIPTTHKLTRFGWLVANKDYFSGFAVLGDLPRLQGLSTLFPDTEKFTIPFPVIDYVPSEKKARKTHDLLFTGYLTKYRSQVLSTLQDAGFSTWTPGKIVTVEDRDDYNRQAQMILNIPQDENWLWLSPMRVMAGLRCGRTTVSLATRDESEIVGCTCPLDMEKTDWAKTLSNYIRNARQFYEKAHADYTTIVHRFREKCPFPHHFLESWAAEENNVSRK